MNSDITTTSEIITGLGFSEAEATIYLALLEMENVSIRKVAERAGINRGTTYDIIKRLVASGLVSVRTIGQREYYSAESPERLYDIIRDKRKDLLRIQTAAKNTVPRLMATKVRPQGRPLVRYYEDDEGVVAVLRDVLQTCRAMDQPEYYAYSSRPLRQYLYRKFPHFTQQRIAEGINVRVIAIGEGGDPAALSARKWLPQPEGNTASSYTLIYGDKVAQISISSDYTPYAVVTEDAGNASMQRLLFRSLWQTL